MNTNQKILIVGGVAGGASAAARLRRLDESANIIMFEKDEYISFANCGLPYYISGEITDQEALTLQTPDSFKARFNVDVRNFNEVTAITPETKTVTVYNHQLQKEYQESYDKLLLSMGAKPIKPNIPGINSNKVFTLRNIPDTYAIKEYVDTHKPKHAIVVGGGFIGIEMAENLHSTGINVTIVEMANQVISPIDYEMACEVHQHLISKGINLVLETELQAINEAGNKLTVTLNNQTVDTDMVIMAIGVVPETKIVKNTEIATNSRGAIIVNDKMETSIKDIYAVGDAIEIKNFVTNKASYVPLAGPANKQGRIAADNICGFDRHYQGTQGSSILKVFDLTVASSGINEKTARELNLNYDKVYTDSLRTRLHELNLNKPIYVTCQIGLRGYIASRILSQNGFDTYNLNGGYRLYNTIFNQEHDEPKIKTMHPACPIENPETIKINACGLQCPGPIVKLSASLETAKDGDIIEIQTTDPAFATDLDGYCRRTGNELIELSCNKGISSAKIKKGQNSISNGNKNNKNMIVFSGDLDKAIASFIIANGAAAMGRKVTMFFTFWGLNIIRRPEKVKIKKNFISKMFAMMMPRGSKKLSLSKMNMGGMGAKMIGTIMKDKNIDSLEDLIKLAQDNGVELIACSMSMDVMGIKQEELIDGVTLSGVATMLANGEESDMSLFI